MVALSPRARELLGSSALAHVVTINPDGSPQVAVAWVGLDGDEIVIGHLNPTQQKVRNLRRDPRIALSVESDATNEYGLRECLVIKGQTRFTDGGAAELLQRLAHTYIGPDVRFPPMDDPPPGVVAHIAVEWVGGIGDWAES